MGTLTETSDWEDVIEIPDDGDDADAASVEGVFRVLASRTRNLLGRLTSFETQAHTWTAPQRFNSGHVANNFGVQGELLYCREDGTVETRERSIMLPLTDLRPTTYEGEGALNGQSSWRLYRVPADVGVAETYEWRPVASDYPLVGLFRLPSGCNLKAVRAGVSVVSGATVNMRAGMNSGGAANPANAGTNVAIVGSFNDLQTLAVPQSDWNGAARLLRVDFRFSTTGIGSLFAAVRSLFAVIDDPGPRNF